MSTSLDYIHDVQHWLSVAEGDYNRYPKTAILRALNTGGAKFSLLTGCISMPVLVVPKANVQFYQLPDVCLKIQTARYYYGDARDSYQELTILPMDRLQAESSDFRGNTGTPAYYLFQGYKGLSLQFGISPYPVVDGTAFNSTNSGVTKTACNTPWVGGASGTQWGLALDIPAGLSYYITTAAGPVGDIKPFTDNIMMDVVRKPFIMAADADLGEIPDPFDEAIVAWAVHVLGRAAYKGQLQLDKAAEGKTRFGELVEDFKETAFADDTENCVQYYDLYS